MGTLARNEMKSLTLKERLERKKNPPKLTDTALIVDRSGSMSYSLEAGQTKMQALRNIVNDILYQVDVYQFNDYCQKVTKDSINDPSGGTVMSRAIETVKQDGFKKAIMLTDGCCNSYDKQATLAAVKDFDLRIMYVGPEPKPEFLDELAKAGGSICTTEDLSKIKELTEKITLLLNPGNSNSGDIQL